MEVLFSRFHNCDEYLSRLKYLGYSRADIVSENRMVYAFSGQTNGGIEDGVEQYYDDARVSFSCSPLDPPKRRISPVWVSA